MPSHDHSPGPSPPKSRRCDAGVVRFTARDITGLVLRTPDMSRKFVQDSSREQWPLPAFGQQGVTGRPDMVITEVSVCCAEDRRVPRGRAR